jgi:hypothetical protein
MFLVRGILIVPLFLWFKFASYKSKRMIDLSVLIDNPELAQNIKIEVSGADLIAFAEHIQTRASEEIKNNAPSAPEEYLNPKQFAEALQISEVTLWNWDKKRITNPLRIGSQKRYRRSDLERILTQK